MAGTSDASDGDIVEVGSLEKVPLSRIRNFSIIAHVDHGKSTLSDRLLQMTNTIKAGSRAQYMDKLQVEQERGITVKAQTATLFYKGHILNLIDTPGHVDFSYEVSRSLAACEGVLLIIDASQGVEAQTLANFLLASKHDLKVVPVVNKIDLPNADIDRVASQVKKLTGVERDQLLLVSGKTGAGVLEPIAGEQQSLLDAIIERIPAPAGSAELRSEPLQALLFDTWYDTFRGVVMLARIWQGKMKRGDVITMKSTGKKYEIQELGIMHPELVPVSSLHAGQVGCIIANVKTPIEARVGDTIVLDVDTPALLGFDPPASMVFAGIYPMDTSEFDLLDKAMGKLTLNDASVSCIKESSNALGLGFRCGFLGLLHMDVFRQRLEQEFNADIIITSPTVPFKARLITDPDNEILVSNPSLFPDPTEVISFSEPVILATIITPGEYLGPIMDLCKTKRGEQVELEYLEHDQVLTRYILPLGEVVIDFYDRLKSVTKGYASLEYVSDGYQDANVVKLTFNLNGSAVDALTTIVHKTSAEKVGRQIVMRLKDVLSRQQFDVAIQANIGAKVVARETIKAVRKNVLVKSGKMVGGGDVSRKKKLLEKQKEGKKRMKRVGNVELSQEAFLSVIGGTGGK